MPEMVQNASSLAYPVHLLRRDDDQEYWTIYYGKPVKMYWSEMTRTQRLLQLEVERRQAQIETFGIYS